MDTNVSDNELSKRMSNDKRKVLNVGQCMPDHGMLRSMIQRNFAAEVEAAHSIEAALEAMRANDYHLVLVNRVIDADGDEGMELILRAKADDALAGTPIMLISNYDDAQDAAVAAGAVPGFGKNHLRTDLPQQRLAEFLAAEISS